MTYGTNYGKRITIGFTKYFFFYKLIKYGHIRQDRTDRRHGHLIHVALSLSRDVAVSRDKTRWTMEHSSSDMDFVLSRKFCLQILQNRTHSILNFISYQESRPTMPNFVSKVSEKVTLGMIFYIFTYKARKYVLNSFISIFSSFKLSTYITYSFTWKEKWVTIG